MINDTPTASPASLRYGEIAPPVSIAAWVEAIWWIRGTADGDFSQDVLPDGCADWIISADGDDGQAESVFVGPMTRRVAVPVEGRANSLGIRFRPGALGGIAKAPLAEMRDCHLDAVPLPLGGAGRLLDAVAAGAEPRELVALVERLLVRWHGLRGARDGAARAVGAVARIAARHGNEGMTVAQIAAGAGMSVRTLRRVFDAAVGVSPKFFARVMRVQDVIVAMEFANANENAKTGRNANARAPSSGAAAALDWADVAARMGFSDQAHLVREFREFTGWTPAAYRAAMQNGRFLQYGGAGP